MEFLNPQKSHTCFPVLETKGLGPKSSWEILSVWTALLEGGVPFVSVYCLWYSFLLVFKI